jgi:hypothetical protein
VHSGQTPYLIRNYALAPGAAPGPTALDPALGDWRFTCVEAGRATSAAPTFFEPVVLWRTWETELEAIARPADTSGFGLDSPTADTLGQVCRGGR